MALTNIANFSISGSAVTIIDTFTQSAVYDSTKVTLNGAIKYYLNGVLQYTSTNHTSGDFYPYLGVRSNTGDQWSYSTGTDGIGSWFQWEFNFTPAPYGKHIGYNHDTSLEADDMSGAMVVAGNGEGKFTQVREDDTAEYTVPTPPVIVSGDKFRIYYSYPEPPASTGTLLPPPPAMVRL